MSAAVVRCGALPCVGVELRMRQLDVQARRWRQVSLAAASPLCPEPKLLRMLLIPTVYCPPASVLRGNACGDLGHCGSPLCPGPSTDLALEQFRSGG
mmetsp:Transcript_108694/g.249217  ORF Transcript_108694/g.249217 Transcript_108694/m.249217 type:complete len:97 (+) Transcript_108694:442-732(+)